MTKKEFQQELKNSANIAVQRANKFLEQLELSLHINWEYDNWEYNGLKSAIGVYEYDSVFEGDISIGFNINNLYKSVKWQIKHYPFTDKYTMMDETIQTNVFHEMGHGIIQYIGDIIEYWDDDEELPFYDNNQQFCDNVLDNEEDSVEEFAWAFYDNEVGNSQLGKLIQLYLNWCNSQQNSINEHDNHYTQYSDIEKELMEYVPYFENKVIMLCCDKPYISEFWNFFQTNLKNLSIPMVVSTFWSNEQKFPSKMTILTGNGVSEKPLKGNGDFLSEEIRNIMSYVDVVVTNPPFSNGMFSSFLQQLKQLGKKFIVIGPTKSAYDGKVFNMFKNGEVSMGHNYDMKFSDQLDGGKLRRKQTSWFTNLETPEKGDFPQNNRNIGEYQKYDNINAINVDFIKDIPTNYNGMIGVPPSVINKIDLNLYKIIDSKENLTINGKRIPKRYIIQRKSPQQNLSEKIYKSLKKMLLETTEIPIDCGTFTKFSQSMPKYASYNYFGNCVNTLNVFGDATTMSQFVNGCTIINTEYVINKLNNGDRRLPKELINEINILLQKGEINNQELIVSGIDNYQRILFIYLTKTDKHYFFDCK